MHHLLLVLLFTFCAAQAALAAAKPAAQEAAPASNGEAEKKEDKTYSKEEADKAAEKKAKEYKWDDVLDLAAKIATNRAQRMSWFMGKPGHYHLNILAIDSGFYVDHTGQSMFMVGLSPLRIYVSIVELSTLLGGLFETFDTQDRLRRDNLYANVTGGFHVAGLLRFGLGYALTGASLADIVDGSIKNNFVPDHCGLLYLGFKVRGYDFSLEGVVGSHNYSSMKNGVRVSSVRGIFGVRIGPPSMLPFIAIE